MNKLPFEGIKLDIITLRSAETSDKFGGNSNERTVEQMIKSGIIVLNKVSGPTSHQVSDYLKRIFGLKKAGHSGTLDPNVTGVLPVALGKATRIVQVLLPAGKEYVCIMHLHEEISKEKVQAIFDKFTGKIKQLPPVKSAVKRRLRERNVYYIELMEIQGQDVLFRIGCQAGTYIRKICHDMGQDLGIGAHMAQLIRTKVGPFDDKEKWTLQQVRDAYWYYKEEGNEKYIRKVIKPVESAVQQIPKVWVFDSAVDSLCHGSDLKMPGISRINSGIEHESNVAVMSLKDELIAIGTAMMSSGEMQNYAKGIAVKTHKIFMEEGTYPKVSLQ